MKRKAFYLGVSLFVIVCILLGVKLIHYYFFRTPPIHFVEFQRMVARAKLKIFSFSTEQFRPGSIVTVDQDGNICGSPHGSLRGCCATPKLVPTEGKGLGGEFVSALQGGIAFDAKSLQQRLPQIRFGTEASSAAQVVLRVPETISVLLESIKIDEWVEENFDTQISSACRNALTKPDAAVISEVIYAPNYSLTFYKSVKEKFEISPINVKGFISAGLESCGGRVEAGSVVFKNKLPLLFTTYRPNFPAPPIVKPSSDFFNDKERKRLREVKNYSGFTEGGDFIRRMQENSYRVNRIMTHIIQGTCLHTIDEIRGEWVKGTPLTNEFVFGAGTTGSLHEPRIFDNDRKIQLKAEKESYGGREFHWVDVGKKFSITITRTMDNALCVGGKRDFILGVNRFKYLDSYVTRVYLDRRPLFVEGYAVDAQLEPCTCVDGEREPQFTALQKTLVDLVDREFVSRIHIQDLREGWVFFRKQIPRKGVFVIRVACQ